MQVIISWLEVVYLFFEGVVVKFGAMFFNVKLSNNDLVHGINRYFIVFLCRIND